MLRFTLRDGGCGLPGGRLQTLQSPPGQRLGVPFWLLADVLLSSDRCATADVYSGDRATFAFDRLAPTLNGGFACTSTIAREGKASYGREQRRLLAEAAEMVDRLRYQ